MSVGIATCSALCNFSLMPRHGGERTPGLHCLHLCLIIAEGHMPELGVCTNMTIDSTGGSLRKPSISASFPSPLQLAYNDVKIRSYALLLFPTYI